MKGSIIDTLRAVRPTTFFAVPRVYEKLAEQLQKEESKHMTPLLDWTKRIGSKASERLLISGSKPWGYALARFLRLSSIDQRLGLNKSKGNLSGGTVESIYSRLLLLDGLPHIKCLWDD